MMQSASDLFLGWTEGRLGRHFYIRQLRDMKIKPLVELFTPSVMQQYADLCGWAIAHAHARSGEPTQISGYLGKSDKFDEAKCFYVQEVDCHRTTVRDGSGRDLGLPGMERGSRRNIPYTVPVDDLDWTPGCGGQFVASEHSGRVDQYRSVVRICSCAHLYSCAARCLF